jgi:hypothetical protein
MKKINQNITLLFSSLNSKNGRLMITLLTLALFVLSASAPSAMIGIGK